MSRILVTGGAGFIGSNFVRWILSAQDETEVVNLDKLTYAGNSANLIDLQKNSRYRFIQGDVADPAAVGRALAGCSAVVHFAAETHVDRSIINASDFLTTNVIGTYTLLEAARKAGVQRYVQISTDEVYGSLPTGEADEQAPLQPNSPYAASKTAADHLARAYHVTYGFPMLIIRASNNYGPYQFPEKFLPLMITNAIEDQSLPIYGDGQYVREWLFVEDFCEAIGLVLHKGQVGQVYNVGSGDYRVNLPVAEAILDAMGKPRTLLHHVTDRLGHDRRYALASGKIRALGWSPKHRFEQGLDVTIRWYKDHSEWWRPLKTRAANFRASAAPR